ncbi:MAG: transcriptional regulator [Phycisphaerales bacterium]|nr:transcriptional regulator [Phycisphaerales bacterium]
MNRNKSIGRAELEVLRYISEHRPATVGMVAGHFAEAKGYVRTTVQNVMQRLCDKGFLVRRKAADGVFQYEPRAGKGELLRSLVRDFVDRSLGGSLSPFVAYLAEDAKLSDDDLRQLHKIVRDLDAQREGTQDHGAPRRGEGKAKEARQ